MKFGGGTNGMHYELFNCSHFKLLLPRALNGERLANRLLPSTHPRRRTYKGRWVLAQKFRRANA